MTQHVAHRASDEIARLKALNAELVEVLKAVDSVWPQDDIVLKVYKVVSPEASILHERVRLAIAKAEEQK